MLLLVVMLPLVVVPPTVVFVESFSFSSFTITTTTPVTTTKNPHQYSSSTKGIFNTLDHHHHHHGGGGQKRTTTTSRASSCLSSSQQGRQQRQRRGLHLLHMSNENNNDNNDNDNSKNVFWQQQRQLMTDLQGRSENSLRKEQLTDFQRVQSKLVQETVFCSCMIFPLLWLSCDSPFVALSYLFGSVFGVAYTFGLGKYVETLGGTVEDAAEVQGAGVGQARFAFLVLLFVLVGKLKVYGLMELPSIGGFFTYQIASLTQGLREE